MHLNFIIKACSNNLSGYGRYKYSLFLSMFATKIRTLKTKPHIFIGIFSILTIISCAKMGSLGGGPKDSVAPVVAKCIPENGSVNFASHKVEIYFDEYISLKDLNSKMVVSPPMKPAPEVIVSGKKLIVKINTDSLQASKTYQINFGNAIVDVNENNPLNGFVYSFSTGGSIDSLKISGTIIDAQSLKPIEGAIVSLYSWETRELFYDNIPQYLTFTDKSGNFSLEYLAEGNYAIFALKDANNNYYFDQATESIAFSNIPVIPTVEVTPAPDDSTTQIVSYGPQNLSLKLFTEDKQQQYILKTERPAHENIRIVFANPNRIAPKFQLDGKFEYLHTVSKNQDTINIWLTQKTEALADSIPIFISYYSDNSLIKLVSDTVVATRNPKARLTMLTVSVPKQQNLFSPLNLIFSTPISTTDSLKIILSENKNGDDPIPFSIKKSENPCYVEIDANLESGGSYYIILAPNAFSDTYGQTTSADTLNFAMKRNSDYGTLIIHLPDASHTSFAELLMQDKVKYNIQTIDEKIVFENISVGKYTIRITQDLNSNGYWDSGNLTENTQPEPVFYYSGEYEVRSNWQHELEWAVPFNTLDK